MELRYVRRNQHKSLAAGLRKILGSGGCNTCELEKSAYSRISMITKLKYVGVQTADLLDIYKLFVRSRAQCMSVAWNSNMTADPSQMIRNVRKTSIKIILADRYTDYESSLVLTRLDI